MALVVEDGTGLPNATTWATRAELIAWAGARGITIPDDDKSDVNLVKAMDWLSTQSYVGALIAADQGTPFPRLAYVGETDVLLFPSDEVPAKMKRAQLMLATAASQGYELSTPVAPGPRLKRRKTGPMEREYFDDGGDSRTLALVPGVDELIAGFLAGGGGSFKLTARRA